MPGLITKGSKRRIHGLGKAAVDTFAFHLLKQVQNDGAALGFYVGGEEIFFAGFDAIITVQAQDFLPESGLDLLVDFLPLPTFCQSGTALEGLQLKFKGGIVLDENPGGGIRSYGYKHGQ